MYSRVPNYWGVEIIRGMKNFWQINNWGVGIHVGGQMGGIKNRNYKLLFSNLSFLFNWGVGIAMGGGVGEISKN